MTSGNLKKLYIIYWRHQSKEWENARTTELYRELTYNDRFRPTMRDNLDFRFMNCNRHSESYAANASTVSYYRRYKLVKEPLIYLEFKQPNEKGLNEEIWSIDSDYRLKEFYKTLDHYLNDSDF